MPESPGQDARACPRHSDLKGQQEDSEDWRTGAGRPSMPSLGGSQKQILSFVPNPPKHTILSSHQIKPERDI